MAVPTPMLMTIFSSFGTCITLARPSCSCSSSLISSSYFCLSRGVAGACERRCVDIIRSPPSCRRRPWRRAPSCRSCRSRSRAAPACPCGRSCTLLAWIGMSISTMPPRSCICGARLLRPRRPGFMCLDAVLTPDTMTLSASRRSSSPAWPGAPAGPCPACPGPCPVMHLHGVTLAEFHLTTPPGRERRCA